MIPGTKPITVRRYLPIDRNSEGCGWVSPPEGQQFLGIPFSWRCDHSPAYIEVQDLAGKVLETVNALDCYSIEFDQ